MSLPLLWSLWGGVSILGVFASALAWSWLGRAFFGFLIASDWSISGLALFPWWSGAEAGLKSGMRVLAIDGLPAGAPLSGFMASLSVEPGLLGHRFLVSGPAGSTTHLLPSVELGFTDFFLAFGGLLVAGWLSVVVACVGLAFPYAAPGRRRAVWANLAFAVWCFAWIIDDLSGGLPGVFVVATAGLSAAVLALNGVAGLATAAERRTELIIGSVFVAPAALVGATVNVLFAYGLALAPAVDFFRTFTWALLGGSLLALTGHMAFRAWRHQRFIERCLAGWLCASLIFGLLITVASAAAAATFDSAPLASGWLACGFLPALLTASYVGIRKQTVALEQIGGQLLRLLLIGMASFLAFLSLSMLIARLTGHQPGPTIEFLVSAFCVGGAVSVAPFLKTWLDPLLSGKTFDTHQVVGRYARAAREAFDPDLVASLLLRDLGATLGVIRGVVYLVDQGNLSPTSSVGNLEPRAVAASQLNIDRMQPGKVFEPDQVPGLLAPLSLPFNPTLALCVGNDDLEEPGLLGLLVLGSREADKPYGAADRDLVAKMGSVMARAVQTTRLLSRRAAEQRQRREVEAVSEVQANMLPREFPALEGADLEAYARSGREVGGDFYDVLPVDDNRWGILIGEATGSGISAALLASVALSFFRATSNGTPSAAETLRIVNNLVCLYRYGLSGHVSATYAVYDKRERSLSIANAGHLEPLANGCPIELEGVPLGLGLDASYAETQVSLKKGDAIIWYTDGVVAAKGQAGEPLGFEALQAFARDGGNLDVDSPWRLREFLRGHVGQTELLDDMTYLQLLVR